MVQLKSKQETIKRSLTVCFNSCMVQLKLLLISLFLAYRSRFNSCMVQLKLERPQWTSQALCVLIPVWCN